MKATAFLIWSTLAVVLSLPALAIESRFPSGLLRHWASDGSVSQAPEQESVYAFIDREYGALGPGFVWRKKTRIPDHTHSHWTFELLYQGTRVVDRVLRIHFNRQGFVEYASANFDIPFSKALSSLGPAQIERDSKRVRQQFLMKHGVPPGRLRLEPVIWVESSRVVQAYELVLTAQRAGVFRRAILDARTLQTLREFPVVRYAKVYMSSPLGGAVPEEVQLSGLADPQDKLKSTRLTVRRDQLVGGQSELVEVDPDPDYSQNVDFSTDPADYSPLCTGGPTDCPNQAFEAVNLYYHLQQYRSQLATYLAGLGSSVSFSADPLSVIVNSLGVDLNGDGDGTNEANNAAYISIPCRDDDPQMKACLIFLRPAEVSTSVCGGTTVFYSLAREALVAVHEYQHYVTDLVTQMVPGTSSSNVGDALHEGYSDYFAASHVSHLVGEPVTAIGEYGFQNCPAIVRDVATLKVFDSESGDPGPHLYGWSWARGLWKLRSLLGRVVADRIALKSLFFLSTTPGFLDAVEALVQADKALYQGEHVGTIRSVLYEDVRFLGGQTAPFRDAAKGVVELGLTGCASVSRHHGGGAPVWIIGLLWLLSTLLGARAWRRQPW